MAARIRWQLAPYTPAAVKPGRPRQWATSAGLILEARDPVTVAQELEASFGPWPITLTAASLDRLAELDECAEAGEGAFAFLAMRVRRHGAVYVWAPGGEQRPVPPGAA